MRDMRPVGYPCPICWIRLVYGEGAAHMGQHRREGWSQTCCALCHRFIWCKEVHGRWLCGEHLPTEVTR